MQNTAEGMYVKAGTRLGILVLGVMGLALASYSYTGVIVPVKNPQAAVFQSGLLLVLMGSLLLEDKFTRPVDAVVNAITGMVCLGSVIETHYGVTWIAIFSYLTSVFLAGIVCITLGVPGERRGVREAISRVLYVTATALGKAQVLFSVVFLFAVFSYYGYQSHQTLSLLVFWGVYIALWPLKLPHLLQHLFEAVTEAPDRIGSLVRMESPNLIRVELSAETNWDATTSYVVCSGDSRQYIVCPLYTQIQNDKVIGVGVTLQAPPKLLAHLKPGGVYTSKNVATRGDELLKRHYALDRPASPLGVVGYGSTISTLQFESWRPESCREGLLVFVPIDGVRVYYQVVEGTTREETFESNLRGFHRVTAVQLGLADPNKGFRKYPWLPQMNIPVFLASEQESPTRRIVDEATIELGTIPGTGIPVFGNLNDLITHHTAVLGVTGTGKTEFAFDLIRAAAKRSTKVLCVDLTGEYTSRLADLQPKELSLLESLAHDLGEKLFAVETGAYGAGKEKAALQLFADDIRSDVRSSVKNFMEDSDSMVGVFSLPTISNTKATIYVTEIYVSSIFQYAKNNRTGRLTLVVLEEAHTVIPETATMGLGDSDSKAMVAKIAQIALQGRKYGVGLLVVAQRTATISKTVLTQCNTIFSFGGFDQTGLDFLSNFYGRDHAALIPNLRFLHAIAFGKGVYTERPLEIEMPFDQEKERKAKALAGNHPPGRVIAASEQTDAIPADWQVTDDETDSE